MKLSTIRPIIGMATAVVGGIFMIMGSDGLSDIALPDDAVSPVAFYLALAIIALVLMLLDARTPPVNGAAALVFAFIAITVSIRQEIPTNVLLCYGFWPTVLAADFLRSWLWPVINGEDPDDVP